jgi:hypothetical protein
MGNFFKKVPTDKFDEKLIEFLKTKKLQDINDVGKNGGNHFTF